MTAEYTWVPFQGSALFAKVVHLWLPYKGFWANHGLGAKANQYWDPLYSAQILVLQLQGQGLHEVQRCESLYSECRDTVALSSGTAQGHSPGGRCQLTSLEILLNLTPNSDTKPCESLKSTPDFHESWQCLSSHLSLHDLLSVCATQFCPNSRSRTNAFPWLHKNPLASRPLFLVTSLKMEGFGEESHHRLAAFCFPFTCSHLSLSTSASLGTCSWFPPHLPKSSSPTSRPSRETHAALYKRFCWIRFLSPFSVPCPYRKLASGELHLVFLCCCFKQDKTSHHEEVFAGYFEDIISFRSPSYPDMWSIGQAFLSCLRCEESMGRRGERPVLGHSVDYLISWNWKPDLSWAQWMVLFTITVADSLAASWSYNHGTHWLMSIDYAFLFVPVFKECRVKDTRISWWTPAPTLS